MATRGSFRTALLSASTVVLVVAVIVTGLAAVGIVRSAVGGSDALSPLSQEAVGDHLRTATAPGLVGPTAHPPTVGPTAPPGATPSASPSVGPARTANPTGGPPPSTSAPSSTSRSSAPSPGAPTPPPSSTSPTPPPTPSPAPTSQTRLIYSGGGSVVAVCTGTLVRLQSFSPAQGYQVAEAEPGPARQVSVVFRATSGTRQVEVQISCRSGVPVAEVDDSGSGGGSGGGYGGDGTGYDS